MSFPGNGLTASGTSRLPGHMAQSLRDDAEFGQMRAQRIDRHGPLTNEQVARPVHHQHRLLIPSCRCSPMGATHRDEGGRR
jgi:hypothetical protein